MSTQNTLPEYMIAYPTVFAVANTYQIFVPFSDEVIMWVNVGDKTYCDDCNGIFRSNTRMHRVELPMTVLNEVKEYTVVYRKMIDRTPYYPKSEDERHLTVKFSPVPDEGDINIYHVADTHNLVQEPIKAGRFFGDDLHLLVLNGDIPNHSGDIKNFDAICEIASGITGGKVPVVFSRGNHDTRGIHAEDMSYYTPTRHGKTYYTFRVGSIWGMVLDCGEDKRDESEEYGYTVCFHNFRLRETDFIKTVMRNKISEYEAEGVKHRLIISHIPFTYIDKAPFDIEQELYAKWSKYMREKIKPDLLLYGHHHKVEVSPVGSDFDHQGQACTAIIGSKPIFDDKNGNSFIGCALTLLEDGDIRVVFNDDKGNVFFDEIVG